MPEWNKWLLWVMIGAIILLVFQSIFKPFETPADWIGIVMMGVLLYYIYTKKEFQSQKFIITAVLPLLIVNFLTESIRLISQSFYTKYHNWIDAAGTFAVLWAIGTLIVTRRQQKELNKAREKALQEEQNNKVISAMKDQLEVQVTERTAELRKQKEELEHTLEELKATQAQLIQSEKMASLGELTAGIAHEIQNPLNFVNNFSEINRELLGEMKDEIAKGNFEGAASIASDVIDNEEKINHHGKRADGIVKGMLQHSRKSSGQKESTNINTLCDEYVRLSYHGLRAKDKSFNAKFETHFDESIQNINIVPQEIGRVILNLINNAFYAVNERKEENTPGYEPTVTVATKKMGNHVCITVSDNGKGIPPNIREKIFQPFFTTKKTGQGTGLGLSLSYDIVKAHGGDIRVETLPSGDGVPAGKEMGGTKFIVTLPI